MDDRRKKRIDICFTIEENYAQHACVTISSMLKNNPDVFFSIYILSFGLNKGLKKAITSVFNDQSNQEIFFIDSEARLVANFKVTGHASPVNYLRLFVPSLLPSLNKILYLDCDIIVRSSLIELFEIDIDNVLFAAVPQKDFERSTVLEIGEDDYLNSGVLLLNIAKWRSENATSVLTDFIVRNPTKIHYWDQDALSGVYHNKYLKIDEKWNFMNAKTDPLMLDEMDVRIIHFVGMHKPWSPYCTHSLRGEYYKYLTPVEFNKPIWSISNLSRFAKHVLNKVGIAKLNLFVE